MSGVSKSTRASEKVNRGVVGRREGCSVKSEEEEGGKKEGKKRRRRRKHGRKRREMGEVWASKRQQRRGGGERSRFRASSARPGREGSQPPASHPDLLYRNIRIAPQGGSLCGDHVEEERVPLSKPQFL